MPEERHPGYYVIAKDNKDISQSDGNTKREEWRRQAA